MAAPRTRTLPRATPISWEAEAPTERFPTIPAQRTASEVLPAAAPYGSGPFAAPTAPAPGVAGRFAVSAIAAVLALIIAVALLGALLELTGAVFS
ncbi:MULTISPECIES: hypothetical protein [unclassified Pseudonocardia]|jgi:hypothetical protein|uniref:hypothetical protein n=1 Tax=unclassified Pseudonocardia TaxID=2619320 RepID=UPI00095B5F1D|nr:MULTISPECIES: hypothetical protein [unclassified Pseudonocardia]MBN9098259.1 hypothetical protein [Pseudonocardia sp.]OJY52512.1 MAG: hypothetical protein BGP03_31785 [Pseudonocardia sp. 73-21]